MKIVMTDVWKTPENKLPEDIEICHGDFVRIKRFEHFRVVVTQITILSSRLRTKYKIWSPLTEIISYISKK